MTTNERIAEALSNPEATKLSQDEWALMWERLWQMYEQTAAQNEYLKMQLLFYAGSDTKWPN